MFNSGWTASLKSVAALYKTNDISLPLFYCHFNYALSNIWEFELQHLSRGHWKNRQMNTAAVSLLRQQWHTHWRIRATNVLYKPLCPFEHVMFAAHTMAASEASPVDWSEGCGDVRYRGPGALLEAMGYNPGLWGTQARQFKLSALINTLNPGFQPEINEKYIQYICFIA